MHLPVIEARVRRLVHGEAASDATHGVGYGRVPQLTRAQGRMCAQHRARDICRERADDAAGPGSGDRVRDGDRRASGRARAAGAFRK